MSSLNKVSYFCFMYKVGIWVMPHKALQWSLAFKYSTIFNMGALFQVYLMTSWQLCFLLFFILSVVGGAIHHDSKKMFLNHPGKYLVVSTFLDHSFLHVSGNFRETDTNTLILCWRVWVPCQLCWNIVNCWEVYTGFQGCTLQNNIPVLLLYQVAIII